MGQEMHGFAGGNHGPEVLARGIRRRRAGFYGVDVGVRVVFGCGMVVLRIRCVGEEIAGRLSQNNFHDGFAVASAGNTASQRVGVTTASNERGIANATGKLAASAAGGSAGKEVAVRVKGDGPDGALLMTAVMFGGVGILAAELPGDTLGVRDEVGRLAKSDAMVARKAFSAISDEHHVRRIFEHGARGTNRIANMLKAGDGSRTEIGAVHNDGVALYAAFFIQMRAEARV